MIDRPFANFVHDLAARTPTPGGGAAGGFAAAMGTALLLMVVRFARGKKANAAREGALAAAERKLGALQAEILPLAERDCASFAPVAAAYQMPQATEADKVARQAAIEAGLLGAMTTPLQTLQLVHEALATAAPIADCANKTIVSDLAAGAELLRAAAEIALLNVRVNTALLGDAVRAQANGARARASHAEIVEFVRVLRGAADRLLGT